MHYSTHYVFSVWCVFPRCLLTVFSVIDSSASMLISLPAGDYLTTNSALLRNDLQQRRLLRFPPLHRVCCLTTASVYCFTCGQYVNLIHSPASSTEINNACSCASTPSSVFMAWCLMKHRGNFFNLLSEYEVLVFSNRSHKKIDSMKQRRSWKANSRSSSQKIPSLLLIPRFSDVWSRTRKWSLSWSTLIQPALTSYFTHPLWDCLSIMLAMKKWQM